ncbi:MAG: protein-tyrosine-phosphatase [Lacibacter sp.]
MQLLPSLQQRCQVLAQRFNEIPDSRKEKLSRLVHYVQQQLQGPTVPQLVFVCTHNSRRSHLAQVWAAIAAAFYGVPVQTFSAGTEATALHPHAVAALQAAGCRVETPAEETTNPPYRVFIGEGQPLICFSKTLNHPALPKQNFAAVMTCSEADAACPVVPGCAVRVALTYHDPKAYDGTLLQTEKYTERSNQIAQEMLYVFAQVVRNASE